MGKKGRRKAGDDDDDDGFVDPIAAALAAGGGDDAADQPAQPPTAKKPSKAEQRKQKKKAKARAQDDDDDEDFEDPVAKALAAGGDDDDDDEPPAPAQPAPKKLSKAEQRKQKKKGKGRAQDDDDDDDDFEDPIAKALAAEGDEDDDDDDEPPAPAQPALKKLSKAEQRKQKKKGKGRAQDDDDDDDFEDPIAKALAAGGDEDDDDDDDDEPPAPAQPAPKKLSKAEQRKQKKKGKGRAQDDDEDFEDPIAKALAAGGGDDKEGDEPEAAEEEADSEAPDPPESGDSHAKMPPAVPVDEPQRPTEPKKKLSKAERKKLKKGGVVEEEVAVEAAPAVASGASGEASVETKEEANEEAKEEAKEEVKETKSSLLSLGRKKKEGAAPSAFASALAKKYEEKKEDEEDEAEGDESDLSEKLAKYEKKLAKAEKKGESAEVERYQGKVDKYKAKIEAAKAKASKAAEAEASIDSERAAAAAGGLLSGKDGDAWRDDSNDALKAGAVEATFEEALAAAVEANDGKPLGAKAKKKLEKDWNARRRAAVELAEKEKRSLEGAQFAVSQSAIDENDANWTNALDVKIDSFSISAAGKTLFENSPLSIVHGRRYGIVGPNGRGKTTLLKMIASGELKTPPRIHCLYVEQEVMADDTKAVDAVLRADRERTELLDEEKELAAALEAGTLSANEQRETSERLAEVGEQLLAIGAHAAESKARRILFGLGFSAEMQMRPTKLFSGGWRMRISLARALFIEPTLLMLDEPTNHLDLNAVIWLDDYLQKYKHTLMVVSHDQDFLNSVCVEILHISEERKLDAYRGNYDTFKTLEEQKRAQQQKEWEKQQKQLRALKSKGSTSKAKAEELVKKQAQNKREPGARSKKQAVASGQESSEVAQLIERPREYLVKMEFPTCATLSPPVLQVCDAGFRYSPALPYIFTEMNFGIDQETRVCVVGNNGSGKSTLLNLLTGKLNPTDGEIKRNPRLRIGVYNQHFVERLPMDESPVDYLRRLFQEETYQSIRNMLGRYGLSGHAHTIAMRDLSGGQKARVVLCELSLMNPHMLLLDEPTNNLDIETIDALCDAINGYNGGVVCVTHDARLIEATNMRLWVVENRQVTEWGEPFEAYRDHLLTSLEEAMAKEDQRVTAAGLSVDMGGNRN